MTHPPTARRGAWPPRRAVTCSGLPPRALAGLVLDRAGALAPAATFDGGWRAQPRSVEAPAAPASLRHESFHRFRRCPMDLQHRLFARRRAAAIATIGLAGGLIGSMRPAP